jgi:hypothetical protein
MHLRFRASFLALLLAAFSLHPSPASARCGWQVLSPPDPDPNASELVGVAAITASDVWAFGGSNTSPPLQLQHFDGTSWRLVAAPALPPSAGLNSMRAVSTNDIWAVGYQQPGSQGALPLIVHWDGTNWSVIPNPVGNTNGELFSVVPIGDKYVWAVGFYEPKPLGVQPLIEHFNGHHWVIDNIYNPPSRAVLQAITGTSLNNIWAGGYGGGGAGALIERWNRTTWSWSQSPTNTGNYVDSMSARSSSDVWAVGPPSGGLFVERWDGTAWRSVRYPRGGSAVLAQVDATASTGYTWFVGDTFNGGSTAFVDRYRGQWRDMKVLQVGSSTQLNSVSSIPGSTGGVWVVGQYYDPSSRLHDLAERYACTQGGS